MSLSGSVLEAAPTRPSARAGDSVRAEAPQVWFDGGFVDAGAACAPLTTHALHYGSGVFEGIRAYATVEGGAAVFRLPEHLERMRRGCELLGIPFDTAEATEATLQVLRRNGHRDAYVRPLAWCGTGSIGLDVTPLSKHLMVAAFATDVHLAGSRVRQLTDPTVSLVTCRFGASARAKVTVQGETDVRHLNARGRRQAAHRKRGAQWIFFLAQVRNHANSKISVGTPRALSRPLSRLIDYLSFSP